jgi:hypothetical protein
MHVNVDGTQNQILGDTFSETMDGGLDFDFRPLPLNDVRVFVKALETLHAEILHFQFECAGNVLVKARVHREAAAGRAQTGDARHED